MMGVRRVLRWKPENYWQVWLIDAAGFGLILLIIGAALGKPLVGLVTAAIASIARGAIQSYRLDRRRDAALLWTGPGRRSKSPR
jgi:hypothetical protein